MRFADQFSAKDLHLVPGLSPGGTLCQLGISWGSMCVAEDDLSCGPLMPLDIPDDFRKLRWQYWAKEEDAATSEGPHLRTPFIPMDRLHTARDRVRSAERIFLWFGTTLLEQLVLVWVVSLFKALDIETGSLQLLELKSPRPNSDRSIGMLNSENIRKMANWRQPAEGELASYESAWQAVSSPSPQDLIAMCTPDSQHPTALNDALRAFLARYPDKNTGLNYWDRLLLENCRTVRRKTALIVGSTKYAGYEAGNPDWPGDHYLFERLIGLSDASEQPVEHTLVRFFGNPRSAHNDLPMRFTEAAITEIGQRVLAGEANHVTLNGIDEWVGGVRLNSRAGSPWVFDGGTLIPGGAA